MTAIQSAIGHCHCGGRTVITPTVSQWEFESRCEACTKATVISWAHAHPPPTYKAPKAEAMTLPLFERRP